MDRIIVLGGDGYLGWPLALKLGLTFPQKKIVIVDDLSRRMRVDKVNAKTLVPIKNLADRIAKYRQVFELDNLEHFELDILDFGALGRLFSQYRPETIFHLAHQPSAPYSMLSPENTFETVQVNELGTLGVLWGVRQHCRDAHLILMGSMGGYAQCGIDIPESGFRPMFGGKTASCEVPFPRRSDDFYHLTKVSNSNFGLLASRQWRLKITDVQQSTVFGNATDECLRHPDLATRFDYDSTFGTVLNRFVAQLLTNTPLTVYGSGHQSTGLCMLNETVDLLVKLAENPASDCRYRLINNLKTRVSIRELAVMVQSIGRKIGFSGDICYGKYDPRGENQSEQSSFNVVTDHLEQFVTLRPLLDGIEKNIEVLLPYIDSIDPKLFVPQVLID